VIVTAAICVLRFGSTPLTSSVVVWYLDLRPSHRRTSADGKVATLVTSRDWPLGGRYCAVPPTQPVDCPAKWGGGRLAIVSFPSAGGRKCHGAVAAFAAGGDHAERIWSIRLDRTRPPKALTLEQRHEFYPDTLFLVDMFPDHAAPRWDAFISGATVDKLTPAAVGSLPHALQETKQWQTDQSNARSVIAHSS
jgi:hypothetical protein